MTEAWEYLKNASYLKAVETGYTEILGGWFYLVLAMVVIAAVQFKTNSSEATSLAMLILGAVGGFLNFFPPSGDASNVSMGLVYLIIMGVGMTMIAWKLFKK